MNECIPNYQPIVPITSHLQGYEPCMNCQQTRAEKFIFLLNSKSRSDTYLSHYMLVTEISY